MHTGPTGNPRGCAYRLRDITDWQTHQGAVASIPQSPRLPSGFVAVRIGGQGMLDPLEQIAHLMPLGGSFAGQLLLLVQ